MEYIINGSGTPLTQGVLKRSLQNTTSQSYMYKNTISGYPGITKDPTTISENHIQKRRYSPSTTNKNYASLFP